MAEKREVPIIILDDRFRILMFPEGPKLEQLVDWTDPKTDETTSSWKLAGYYSDMILTLRGYIKKAVTAESSLEDMLRRMTELEEWVGSLFDVRISPAKKPSVKNRKREQMMRDAAKKVLHNSKGSKKSRFKRGP